MTIDKQKEDLQYQIHRIDGHSLFNNIGNRIHGLLEIGISIMSYSTATKYNFPINTALYLIGTTFVIDGISSLITGKLHYVFFRVTKSHPKYELERLEKEREP